MQKLILTYIIGIMFYIGQINKIDYSVFNEKLEEIRINNELSVYTGGGGNSGIFVTKEDVFVIDTKMGEEAEKLYKIAKEKAGGRKIIVINTHIHRDHTGGNKFYKGSQIYIGKYETEFLEENLEENEMPTDYIEGRKVLESGGEEIEILNFGQGHTYTDLVVYIKKYNIVFTGDLLFNKVNPVVKKESGADIDKWEDGLEMLLKKWSGAKFVPGHGNVGKKEIVENMIKYFKDMKTAAKQQEKEKEIIAKYSDWMVLPKLSSPEITIEILRNKN